MPSEPSNSCTAALHSSRHNHIRHANAQAPCLDYLTHPALGTEPSASSITEHTSSSVTGLGGRPGRQQPASSGGSCAMTGVITRQAGSRRRAEQQWLGSNGPQPSLVSFDSAVPARSTHSMTTHLQPRAFSASQVLACQPALFHTGGQQGPSCSAIEALSPGSKNSWEPASALSPDVSKISFRILTSGSRWAGQRGPCSPLTPIPDSPCSPLQWCRYHIFT